MLQKSAASPSSSLMLDYTTRFAKQAASVSRERQWAWEREAAEGPGEQNCILHSSHRFFWCSEKRQRSHAELYSMERELPIHHLPEPCIPPLLKTASHLSFPQHFFSHDRMSSWHFRHFPKQSRIQQQVFNGVSQLKQDCIFRQKHIFMWKDKTDYLGPDEISLLSVSLGNRAKL